MPSICSPAATSSARGSRAAATSTAGSRAGAPTRRRSSPSASRSCSTRAMPRHGRDVMGERRSLTHALRVTEGSAAFRSLCAAIEREGERAGWLDLSALASRSTRRGADGGLGAALDDGAWKAVGVEAGRSVAIKRRRGAAGPARSPARALPWLPRGAGARRGGAAAAALARRRLGARGRERRDAAAHHRGAGARAAVAAVRHLERRAAAGFAGPRRRLPCGTMRSPHATPGVAGTVSTRGVACTGS